MHRKIFQVDETTVRICCVPILCRRRPLSVVSHRNDCLFAFVFTRLLRKIELILRISVRSDQLSNGIWKAVDPFTLEELHFEEASAGECSEIMPFVFYSLHSIAHFSLVVISNKYKHNRGSHLLSTVKNLLAVNPFFFLSSLLC